MKKSILNIVSFSILFTFISLLSVKAQIKQEYIVKAAYIEKLTKYITWPENNHTDFTIVIFGDDPFDNNLQRFYNKSSVQGKKIIVQYVSHINDIQQADLIFIPHSKRKYFNTIHQQVKNKPILLITESEGYARLGSHINFYLTTDNKIRFEINQDVIKKSPFKFKVMLLKSAKIIES